MRQQANMRRLRKWPPLPVAGRRILVTERRLSQPENKEGIMEGEASTLISLLPLLVMSSTWVPLGFILAKRKGRSPVRFAILVFIPLVGFVFLLYLIALTDQEVYDRLDRIEALLKQGKA